MPFQGLQKQSKDFSEIVTQIGRVTGLVVVLKLLKF